MIHPDRFLNHRVFRRLSFLVIGGLSILGMACSGRVLHPELRDTPRVLVRQWTLPTHGPYEAGDHGYEFSNPVEWEGTLIFGNHSTGISSIYPGWSRSRWKLSIKNGVVSELTIEKGVVYFGGGDGHLYAVQADTGRVLWKYDLKNPMISKPAVVGGRVFVSTTDDAAYAFDAGTGKWLWHYRRRTAPPSTILGASSPAVFDETLYVGMSDGFLVALSTQDGQLKWQKKLHNGLKFTDIDAHPIIEGERLYVPSYDGATYCLKIQDGEIIWKFDAGGSKQVVIDGNRVYLPSSDGSIYALQKENGRELWKFHLDQGTPTRLVFDERHLFFGSSHQYFYTLSKETGRALYRFNAGYGNGFYGSPWYSTDEKHLYTLSSAGNLYAFSVRQPARKQRLSDPLDPYEDFR